MSIASTAYYVSRVMSLTSGISMALNDIERHTSRIADGLDDGDTAALAAALAFLENRQLDMSMLMSKTYSDIAAGN